MKNLFSLFVVLFLCGCTYTDVYVHEETDMFRKYGPDDRDSIVEVFADVELMLYPDLTYFRPGYDNQLVLLNVVSKESGSIHISNVQYANIDTGVLHVVNEDATSSLAKFQNLEVYGSGIRLSVDEVYSKIYGASEIEMTVTYSMNGRPAESKAFKLKRITDVFFILGAA